MRSNRTWTIILAVTGIIVVWISINFSESYSHGRAFLYTNPEINSEFGRVRYFFLYNARIHNSHADFRYYVFGEKKSGGIALHIDDDNGHWVIRRAP